MNRAAWVRGLRISSATDSADALVECLRGCLDQPADAVMVGVGPEVDAGLPRAAALVAGIDARCPVHVMSGGDASHAALHRAVESVLAGYCDRVIVAGYASGAVAAWPPEGVTDAMVWRLAFPSVEVQQETLAEQYGLELDDWRDRVEGTAGVGSPVGDVSAVAAVVEGSQPEGGGLRIVSIASTGADVAASSGAVFSAGETALNRLQLQAAELDWMLVASPAWAEQAAGAAVLQVEGRKVLDGLEAPEGLRGLLGLEQLRRVLVEQDDRYGMLLSGGSPGLGFATVFDAARFE